ncbi:DUF6760 family protein [Streptomyces sp. NPDC052040]|uniref:DUF6760 family protein n=1 Tax=unclassified Streptomyces TaxID=2593676 RepID=UPI0037D85DE5
MRTYAAEDLRSELAYIAYHFHWPHDQLLDMDHIERRAWISQITAINRRLADGT